MEETKPGEQDGYVIRIREVDQRAAFWIGRLRPHLSPDLDASIGTAYLQEVISFPGNQLYGAFIGQLLVGMALMVIPVTLTGNSTAWLGDLVVAPEYRRLGLGKLLVAAVSKAAKDAGCQRILLTSGQQRSEAHMLYLKSGFRLLPSALFGKEF